MTLAEFTELYWSNRGDRLSQDTRRQYRGLYERHVEPSLGRVQLRELTTSRLLDWQAEVERSDLGAPSLLKLMTFLQGVMSYAVKRDELLANPVRELDKPRQESKIAAEPLTVGEVESVRKGLCLRDQTIVSVLAYAGLRPGELTRLRWEHVTDKSIRVVAGKTGRERSTIVLPPVHQDLVLWHLASEGEQLVFPGFDLRNWRKRVWKPAFAKAGVSGSDRPYRLRSSFVSLLIAADYPLGTIAMNAGHSLEIMGRHYAGIIHEYAGRNIDPVAEIEKARVIA
jgi:integrase